MLYKKNINEFDQEFLSLSNFHNALGKVLKKIHLRPRLFTPKKDLKKVCLRSLMENQYDFYIELKSYCLSGEIKLTPFRKIQIFTNKKRDIYIADWAERILLMMAQNTLSLIAERYLSPTAYAFRKGMGPFLARNELSMYIKKSRKKLFVFQGDISNYGPSIDQTLMLSILNEMEELRSSPILMDVIVQSIQNPYLDDVGILKRLDNGVPSGSPLVPVLENIYLAHMDKEVSKINGCFYGRYGDDFIFIHHDLNIVEHIEARILQLSSESCLSVNESKIVRSALGIEIGGKYQSKTTITWIGQSFTKKGNLLIKQKHYLEFKKKVHVETNSLVIRLKEMVRLSGVDVKRPLKQGLKHMLNKNSELALKFLQDTDDHAFIKEFLNSYLFYLHRLFSIHLCSNKREAWRLVRLVKPCLKDLFYANAD